MLVIPALISLKPSIMEKDTLEMNELIQSVIKRIQTDTSEIVAKTGKKLVLELQKCYPDSFKNNYIKCLKDTESQKICEAIIQNDESSLNNILNLKETSIQSPKKEKNVISAKVDKIFQQQKQDELKFGFVEQKIIDKLDQQNEWHQRTEALEQLEQQLNEYLLNQEAKQSFLNYSNQFIEFLLPLIKDINLKISLIAINIASKLLVLDLLQNDLYFFDLATTLIEKLSDIKVLIRQSILKCCGLLIKKNNSYKFAFIAIDYIRHTNWHVREGVLHLIANCLIVQGQQQELKIKFSDENNQDLTINQQLITELCYLLKNESKQKIQQMVIDILSLCLEYSKNENKTEQLINKELTSQQIISKLKERRNQECLPQMQIDGSIEFKPIDIQQMLQTGQIGNNQNIIQKQRRNDSQQFQKSNETVENDKIFVEQYTGEYKVQKNIQQRETSNKDQFNYQQEAKTKQFDEDISNINNRQQEIKTVNKIIEIQTFQRINSNDENKKQTDIKFEQLMQGYTPLQHTLKPRIIQSNENRQRTIDSFENQNGISPIIINKVQQNLVKLNDFQSLQNQSPILITNNFNKIDSHSQQINYQQYEQTSFQHIPSSVESHAGIQSDINLNQIRNMSQSSGAPGGFRVNKALINERLQLLKSTFKYKNQSEHESRSNIGEINGVNYQREGLKFDDFYIKQKATSEYNPREAIKLPAVVKNNNNFMQTNGSGITSIQEKIEKSKNNQHMHDSFGLSNVSHNITNQQTKINNFKSFSANKQLQSTNNTSAYNYFGNNTKTQNGFDNQMKSNNIYLNDQNLDLNQQRSYIQENILRNNKNQINTKGPVKAIELKNNKDHQYQIQNEMKKMDNHPYNHNDENNISQISEAQKYNYLDDQIFIANKKKQSPNIPRHQQSNNKSLHQNNESSEINEQFQTPMKSWVDTQQQTTTYNALEEPLINPESNFKQSIQNLNSQDWQKVFEALNIIKRIAQFHKELLSITEGNSLPKECIKLIVKQTENLRSQVAKNACMTLQVIYSELPAKDLDCSLDIVIAALVKKSTDTNHFVSEQAEKALKMVCHSCTETKILYFLSNYETQSNQSKLKVTLAFCFLIDKLGLRIKSFKEVNKLLQCIVSKLNEGAIEIRNQAKLAIIQMKNNYQSIKEFDQLLQRGGISEKQVEQIRKIIDQPEQVNIQNVTSYSKYNVGIRGSSLDSIQSTYQKNKDVQNDKNINEIDYNEQENKITKKTQQIKKYGQQKQVDPNLLEELKQIGQQCNTNDWNTRLKSIESLSNWLKLNCDKIENSPTQKFIQIIDIYCLLIQDNNSKVQIKGIQYFKEFLISNQFKQLKEQNISIIISAIAQNLSSSQQSIRKQNEMILNSLDEWIDNKNQFVLTIVSLLNLQQTRCKPQLINKLCDLVKKIDNQIIDKQVLPLLNPDNKIQQEANTNPRLKEALKTLQISSQY